MKLTDLFVAAGITRNGDLLSLLSISDWIVMRVHAYSIASERSSKQYSCSNVFLYRLLEEVNSENERNEGSGEGSSEFVTWNL